MLSLEHIAIRSKIEEREEFKEWGKRLNPIHFNSKIGVKIIPPFLNALTRFVCFYNEKSISVYFDGYSQPGYMVDGAGKPIPYYEAYPIGGDARRHYLGEEEEMMRDIEKELGV